MRRERGELRKKKRRAQSLGVAGITVISARGSRQYFSGEKRKLRPLCATSKNIPQ